MAGIVLALLAALLLAVQPDDDGRRRRRASARGTRTLRMKAVRRRSSRDTRRGSPSVSTPCARRIRSLIDPRCTRPARAGRAAARRGHLQPGESVRRLHRMTPAGFRRFVLDIAARVGFPSRAVWLGGDHLGPNAWRRSRRLPRWRRRPTTGARSTSRPGFRKIHLDCSMACGDDPAAAAGTGHRGQRAARLCAVAERTWREVGGEPPVYVIGTEVPVPGGAGEICRSWPSRLREAAPATHRGASRGAFEAAGPRPHAWPRVIALVVQPGVEFDHHKVIDYRPERRAS